MRLFLDANVLVAILNKEYPVFSYAAKIISLSDRPEFHLFASPTSIAIAFYFSSKKCGEARSKEKIKILLEHIRISTVDEQCTLRAAKNRSVTDLEDGIQYYSAVGESCEFIISENVKDFHFSEIKVVDCESFLKHGLRIRD